MTAAEAEAGIERLRASHDADGDGALSRAEFEALFAEATRGYAERPFTMLDVDRDGQLSAEELQSWPARRAGSPSWTRTATAASRLRISASEGQPPGRLPIKAEGGGMIRLPFFCRRCPCQVCLSTALGWAWASAGADRR